MKEFYYVVMGKDLEPDAAFYKSILHETAFEAKEMVATKRTFKLVECPSGKNPHRLAEKWVEEDKKHWINEKNAPAGVIQLKRSFLTAARRKRPDLKGQKNINAYLIFGRAN